MKITLCENRNWLQSVSFCCYKMEEGFLAGTFAFHDHYLHLIPILTNGCSKPMNFCLYCGKPIVINRLCDPPLKRILEIKLHHAKHNCHDYLIEFTLCCESMNILKEIDHRTAVPTNNPIQVEDTRIYINNKIIKGCPYCLTQFKKTYVQDLLETGWTY